MFKENDDFIDFQKIKEGLKKNPLNLIHISCGTVSSRGYYKDGVIDYLCPKCDVTFLNNEEQTIIS